MNIRGQDSTDKNSGSPKKSEPEFLAIGKLRKPFGLQGEMKFEAYIDDLEVFSPGKEIFLGKSRSSRKIASLRESGNSLLIRLEGINNPEDARILSNHDLLLPADRLPELEEGNYYYRQLIGMRVEDVEGNLLGEIVEIIETGANDVYVIFNKEEKIETLIPAIESVVQKIDIESNLMVVNQLEWLD
ncbi:MAG: 16S rRNA processing protein RimM [Chloroflexi bacterium]|nr:16S rRNA processing protein RimM [Chloroflexota bacterium]